MTEKVEGGIIVRDEVGNIVKDTRGIINETTKAQTEASLSPAIGAGQNPVIAKMMEANVEASSQLINYYKKVESGELPLPPGNTYQDVLRQIKLLETARTEALKPQIFSESTASQIFGANLVAKGYDAGGNLTNVSIRQGEKTTTLDIFGNVSNIQNKDISFNLLTGAALYKDSGTPLNLRSSQDYSNLTNFLTGTGITLAMPREQRAFTEFYAADFEKAASLKGAEAFASSAVSTLGATLGGGRAADIQFFATYSPTSGGFIVEPVAGLGAEGKVSVGKAIGKYLTTEAGNYPYAEVQSLGGGKYLIKQRAYTEPEYVFSKTFGAKYQGSTPEIVSYGDLPISADIKISLEGGKTVSYSELSPTEKTAFNEIILPSIISSSKGVDLKNLLGATPQSIEAAKAKQNEIIIEGFKQKLAKEGWTNIQITQREENGELKFEATGLVPSSAPSLSPQAEQPQIFQYKGVFFTKEGKTFSTLMQEDISARMKNLTESNKQLAREFDAGIIPKNTGAVGWLEQNQNQIMNVPREWGIDVLTYLGTKTPLETLHTLSVMKLSAELQLKRLGGTPLTSEEEEILPRLYEEGRYGHMNPSQSQ